MIKNDELFHSLKQLRKPSLNMVFLKYDSNEPSITSHLGGVPYITAKDLWPTCEKCRNKMTFFMQLREITKDENVILSTYYKCSCDLNNFEPHIQILEYENPRLEYCEVQDQGPEHLPFVEINFQASWSIPSWALLPKYDEDLYNKVMSMNDNDKDTAEDYYDSLRWNENYLATEPYSQFSGYPEFVATPKTIKCACCSKEAEFVFQLDSDDSLGIDWNSGILYCYKCPRTTIRHFIIN
ncbi:DUF1963 domain-containing protein [Bacillus sp. Brlt_9]|uniref:DUF1963 domain-containing protein n=1 Tax=Bacillus sp. Brlt_9 TaxID=3110916 RepID=UPI003F7BCB1E